ncbi:LysM peptidoglycan-binding domain-containing protein [Spirosoma sp. KUDC1026]|uniref:LysM peptidoglycan-binding domain-containing protein n=1 Tax=Spirosoma sp. KUDC1026 TaxID=2745947 RepID=UPI00159BD2C3|nr:LysM peptidoglycan-binding domain-containing protein [Spirosoma sp. KUDC1026]QKZ14368.1 LysM peptidoglycan-binding domain-containing protein [Spirosoma sp. KUDC1026]
MQKTSYPLLLLFFLLGFASLAQTTPTVPEQVTFADISVRLDNDARRLIQQDVNALLANRQYWSAKLDRVALYFPMIETIMLEEGVPVDFKYLAVQESSLTPDAVSSSMAVGYWQFKRETATDYGLRVDDVVDERKSIIASSRAAAKYFKKSNTQFNNWIASLYSYYLGASGITRLIPPDWSYAREVTLDGRTDRYILRFFAHKIAVENALKTHQASNTFALIEYPGGGGKSFGDIASELGVDESELRKYNRWVIGELVPTDKDYVMAIPVPNNQINDVRQKIVNVRSKKAAQVVQNDVGFPVLRRVTSTKTGKNDPVLYEINGLPGIQAQAGDNAGSMARKAKISLSSFLRYNDLDPSDQIIVGDVYYLAKKRKKALVPFHTVRDGETSRSISQRYGLRLKKLLRYNRLDRVQKLVTGRVMWLRERRPGNKPVEVIDAPTLPVYDQTPTPAATRPVASNSTPANAENIPRNASERKVYQPKLVGGGVTPSDGTAPGATAPAPEPVRPVSTAAPVVTTPVPAPSSVSGSSSGSQRVVIVRTPETTTSTSTPVPAPAEERTVASADTKAPAKTPASKPTTSRRAAQKSDPDYEGPREQQADGSLTSPSTPSVRSSTPAVTKADRPATVTTKPTAEAEPTTARSEAAPVGAAPARTTPTKPAPVTTKPVSTERAMTPSSTGTMKHKVEPGQTYYSISKQYGITVDELRAMNNLGSSDVLVVGKELTVKGSPTTSAPASKPAAAAPAKEKETPATGETTYHTVAKGETMFRISKNYGVTIEQIQTWNNLTTTEVKVGQKIKIVK